MYSADVRGNLKVVAVMFLWDHRGARIVHKVATGTYTELLPDEKNNLQETLKETIFQQTVEFAHGKTMFGFPLVCYGRVG